MCIVLRAQYASDVIIVLEESWGPRKGNDWLTVPWLVHSSSKIWIQTRGPAAFSKSLESRGLLSSSNHQNSALKLPSERKKKKSPWPKSEEAPRTCQAFSSEALTPAQCSSLVCQHAPPMSTTQWGQGQIGHPLCF